MDEWMTISGRHVLFSHVHIVQRNKNQKKNPLVEWIRASELYEWHFEIANGIYSWMNKMNLKWIWHQTRTHTQLQQQYIVRSSSAPILTSQVIYYIISALMSFCGKINDRFQRIEFCMCGIEQKATNCFAFFSFKRICIREEKEIETKVWRERQDKRPPRRRWLIIAWDDSESPWYDEWINGSAGKERRGSGRTTLRESVWEREGDGRSQMIKIKSWKFELLDSQ